MVNLPRPPDYVDFRHLPSPAILAQIGRIAAVTAGIEDTLHSIWWSFAGISDDVGPTITEDMKPSRITEDIIKIGRAANVSTAQLNDLADIFAQYKASATDRNQFVHWLWTDGENGNYKLEPPTYKKGSSRTVRLSDIKSVADDLVWIEQRLILHDMSRDQILAMRRSLGEKGLKFAPTPWLDNNLQPIATLSKPRGFQKEPAPRPQSSPAKP